MTAVTTQRSIRRRGETIKKESLADEDVEATLKVKPKVYAIFYASWCPHSRRFLPIFREYAKVNPDECLEVMVDSKEGLCEKYAVEYYPTVLFMEKGKVQRRLDVKPGGDLTKEQLQEFTSS